MDLFGLSFNPNQTKNKLLIGMPHKFFVFTRMSILLLNLAIISTIITFLTSRGQKRPKPSPNMLN